jgi:hypothetical protein
MLQCDVVFEKEARTANMADRNQTMTICGTEGATRVYQDT